MTLNEREQVQPRQSPVSLRTAFLQRRGFPTPWRAAVAALIGLALLIGALAYFGALA
jgi:hypothetical protein